MEDSTITREQFIQLMERDGQAGSKDVLLAVLADLGWSNKATLTKAEVVQIADGIASYGQRALAVPSPGIDDEARENLSQMLGALKKFAIPLLKR